MVSAGFSLRSGRLEFGSEKLAQGQDFFEFSPLPIVLQSPPFSIYQRRMVSVLTAEKS
jgi:hypothetical protein